MKIKYNIDIDKTVLMSSIKKLTNQIFKLLPSKEEGADWETPLSTIIEELCGINRLLEDGDEKVILFTLLCKLEGLYTLTKEEDFFLYRRIIFECLNLLSTLKEDIDKKCQD